MKRAFGVAAFYLLISPVLWGGIQMGLGGAAARRGAALEEKRLAEQVANAGDAATVPPLVVSTGAVSFSAVLDGEDPAPKTLSILMGGGPYSWTVKDELAWLEVSPRSGTGDGAVTLTPAVSGLDVGTFSGTLTITAIPLEGGTGSSATVSVSLGVTNPGPSPLGLVESRVNSDLSDWYPGEDPPELNEDTVFHSLITHTGPGQQWTLKIGKGGQIYSIKTPELGELIAPQRVLSGQWIDEIFQHVLTMPPQKIKDTLDNDIVDGDIHQAGYYTKSDIKVDGVVEQILPHSVYSPLFGYRFYPSKNQVKFITWPQHAHLPRTQDNLTLFQNKVLIRQTMTDLGNGVVQIDVDLDKWAGDVHELVNEPWSAFRTPTLPVQVLSTPEGGYVVDNRLLDSTNKAIILGSSTIGGWFALAVAESPAARGIATVFGRPPLVPDPGWIRWGTYNHANPDLGGTVISVQRKIGLVSGESLRSRYFLIFGTLVEIQEKAKGLEPNVVCEKFMRPVSEAGATLVCRNELGLLDSICGAGDEPVFKAFKAFVPGAQPLFLLKDTTTNEYRLTQDPYAVSFDPTDGRTAYVDWLGWALPESLANDPCVYQPLGEALADLPSAPGMGPNTRLLRVRRLESACPAGGS